MTSVPNLFCAAPARKAGKELRNYQLCKKSDFSWMNKSKKNHVFFALQWSLFSWESSCWESSCDLLLYSCLFLAWAFCQIEHFARLHVIGREAEISFFFLDVFSNGRAILGTRMHGIVPVLVLQFFRVFIVFFQFSCSDSVVFCGGLDKSGIHRSPVRASAKSRVDVSRRELRVWSA
jgi:hypothetical protein